MVVPANTSKQTVAQLTGWFGEAILAPEIIAKLEALGFTLIRTCGKDFASFLQAHRDAYAHVIREAGMKGEE